MATNNKKIRPTIRFTEKEYEVVIKKMADSNYKKIGKFLINSAVKSKIINIDILPLLDIVEKLSAISNEIKFSDDTELSLKSPSLKICTISSIENLLLLIF